MAKATPETETAGNRDQRDRGAPGLEQTSSIALDDADLEPVSTFDLSVADLEPVSASELQDLGEVIDPPQPSQPAQPRAVAGSTVLDSAPTQVIAAARPAPDEEPTADAEPTSLLIPITAETEIPALTPSSERTVIAPAAYPSSVLGASAPAPRAQPVRAVAWPMISVMVTAVIVGVSVAWLVMRGPPRHAASPVAASLDAGVAHADLPPAVVEPTHAPAAPATGTTAPTQPPTTPDPAAAVEATFEALSARYEVRDYQSVVTACRGAVRTTGITTICLMAACHLGDAAQARRWLLAHPRPRRAQLAAQCTRLGHVDLSATTR